MQQLKRGPLKGLEIYSVSVRPFVGWANIPTNMTSHCEGDNRSQGVSTELSDSSDKKHLTK